MQTVQTECGADGEKSIDHANWNRFDLRIIISLESKKKSIKTSTWLTKKPQKKLDVSCWISVSVWLERDPKNTINKQHLQKLLVFQINNSYSKARCYRTSGGCLVITCNDHNTLDLKTFQIGERFSYSLFTGHLYLWHIKDILTHGDILLHIYVGIAACHFLYLSRQACIRQNLCIRNSSEIYSCSFIHPIFKAEILPLHLIHLLSNTDEVFGRGTSKLFTQAWCWESVGYKWVRHPVRFTAARVHAHIYAKCACS